MNTINRPTTIRVPVLEGGFRYPLLHLPALGASIVSDFYIDRPNIRIDSLVKSVVSSLNNKLETFLLPTQEEGDSLPNALKEKWMLANVLADSVNGTSNQMERQLAQDGHTATLGKVSRKIRASTNDPSLKYLLSKKSIYIFSLSYVIYLEKTTDDDGIVSRVNLFVQNEIRPYINKRLAEVYVDRNNLDVFSNNEIKESVLNELAELKFSFLDGQAKSSITGVINKYTTDGRLFNLVNAFFNKASPEIRKEKGTPQVKQLMIKYLSNIGLQVSADYKITSKSTKYDEYLALAYTNILKELDKTDDPITNLFTSSAPDTFNYAVDYFEDSEGQGVEAEHILAAGTLFYIKTLADDLGLIRTADAVLMRWSSGMLDVPQGETSTKLYRYYKLREDRTTSDERAMFYKTVLNVGDGDVLNNNAINIDFSSLWDTLMREVVRYIERYEKKDGAFDVVSKASVYQAIRDLQYNLTMHTSGMVKALLPEMYKQLEHAISILDDGNVKSQLGRGSRRSMWNVVERISIEEFNYMPNVSALRTSAIDGHKIFAVIAGFNEALISEEAFRDFTLNVESFIIAQSQLTDENTKRGNNNQESIDKESVESLEKDEWDF